MKWSLEHYNFICYGHATEPIFQRSAGRAMFPVARLFEYTDNDVKALYRKTEQLASLPTAVVAEVDFRGQPTTTPALLAKIDNVEMPGPHIYFRYKHYVSGQFTSECLFKKLEDIDEGENYRTHWAVKHGNLVNELFRIVASSPTYPEASSPTYPELFNISGVIQQQHQIAVMMPFCASFEPVYSAIKDACGDVINPIRVDDLYGPDVIVDSIFRIIEESKLVVADITGRNANVLYEAGLAHGRSRDVVFLTQNQDHVPFDLRRIRYIKYEPTDRGLRRLTTELNRTVVEYLRKRDSMATAAVR